MTGVESVWGRGCTSETSRLPPAHLSRTWSFEKPDFEPLREPCSLRMFSRDVLSDDGGFTVKHHQQTFV